jgi:hypothetical protein
MGAILIEDLLPVGGDVVYSTSTAYEEPPLPYRRPRPLALLFALLFAVATRAGSISAPLSASGLPWGDRVARDLALKVAVESLDRAAGAPFRERDRVAFRFQVSEVETDAPLPGLRPEAWMAPLRDGETVDPAACVREREVASGWTLVKGPSLDLDLREEAGGTYEAVTRLGRPGRYEVAFFLGSPRLVHCFEVEVRPASRLSGVLGP